MARISVPPPEASRSKKIADANAGSATAKNISRTGSLVSGLSIGKMYSAAQSKMEVKMLTYTVLIPASLPRNMKPTTRSIILIKKVINPGVLGRSALRTTAIPVTPPKEKLFGNLNTYTPMHNIKVAMVSIKYSYNVLVMFELILFMLGSPYACIICKILVY